MSWTNKPDPADLPSDITDEMEREDNLVEIYDHHVHHNNLAAALKTVIAELEAGIGDSSTLAEAIALAGGATAASAVVYDNAESGATETDVQALLDLLYAMSSSTSSNVHRVNYIGVDDDGTPWFNASQPFGEFTLAAGDRLLLPAVWNGNPTTVSEPGIYSVNLDLSLTLVEEQPTLGDLVVFIPQPSMFAELATNLEAEWQSVFDLSSPISSMDNVAYAYTSVMGVASATATGVWWDTGFTHRIQESSVISAIESLLRFSSELHALLSAQIGSPNWVLSGGVISGGAGTSVSVASGSAVIAGEEVTFDGDTFSLTEGVDFSPFIPTGAQRRIGVLWVDDTGVVQFEEGDEFGGFPAALPDENSVLLGLAMRIGSTVTVDDSMVRRSEEAAGAVAYLNGLLGASATYEARTPLAVDYIAPVEVPVTGWPAPPELSDVIVYLPNQGAASARGVYTLPGGGGALTDREDLTLADGFRVVVGSGRLSASATYEAGQIVALVHEDEVSVLSQTAAETPYDPDVATAANWVGLPDSVAEALDQLAARLAALE